MERWVKTLGVGALVVTLVVCMAATQAQPVGLLDDRPLLKCFADNVQRFFGLIRSLDLTSEQKARIAEIRAAHKSEISSALHRLNDAHRTLVAAVRAETPNEAAIRAAAGELGRVIADASVLRARVRAEVNTVLTPEQRRKIDDAIAAAQTSVDKALADFDRK